MRNDRQEMWARLHRFAETASREELEEAVNATDGHVLDADPQVARIAMDVRVFLLKELQAREIARQITVALSTPKT